MPTALITGGSRGIGSACCTVFAENGYDVIINYNASKENALSLENRLLSRGFSAKAVKADVSDAGECEEMFRQCREHFSAPDVLICNAGIAEQRLFTDITQQQWNKMVGVNLTGVFNCCQLAAREMVKNKFGRIINISSIWGVHGASCEVHYSAAKAGVIGLSRALAKELGPSAVTVNCIAPGVIDTDMCSGFDADTLAELSDATPIGRLGTAEDVVAAALFLAGEGAGFITGEVLGVSGGFY